MAYTKYSLTPANNTAAPPDGAPEGMLPSAVNDTMRDMMAQIRDCGDGIRDGTYTMTAPKITGGTITGAAFTGNTFTSPVISGGTINNATIGATTASTGAFTTLSASGVSTFSAGTVSLPAITTTGDTNTGIFFPTADTIAFTEGGVESMRINSSGNVGIGVSPATRFHTQGGRVRIDANSENFAIQLNNSTTANGPFIGSAGADIFVVSASSGAERMRIDSSGNVGINNTSPAVLSSTTQVAIKANASADSMFVAQNSNGLTTAKFGFQFTGGVDNPVIGSFTNHPFLFLTNNTERMRIDSSGNLLVATTSSDVADANGTGASFSSAGNAQFSRASGGVMNVNRKTDDGVLVYFQQDATAEGNISVSGSTVSYNGGHLSRYAQTTAPKDDSLLKGTVLSNLDEMNEYLDAESNPVPNEQLNKVKVSDVEGDVNVAGVFVNWSHDEAHDVDEINMAMTGDMIIRIAEGVVVQKGDLLMSAGDGTAKPQGDDIRRSKTVAKVTSNHVTCTYADGSYCVPCVLMAC